MLTLAVMIIAGLGSPAQAGVARSGQDEGGIGIQLRDAPVNTRGDPRALRYIVDHLAPGAAIERDVLVVNRTDRVRAIEVYPAAATIDDGQFLFGADRTANDLTSWITTDRATLELAPGESALVALSIQVPAGTSPGERYAVLWAAAASDAGTGSVSQINRVGIRVYLDVGAGGAPATDFTMGRFTAARGDDGMVTVTLPVTNSGGRAVDLSGSAALTDGPAGLNAGPFAVARTMTLAPGDTGDVVVRLAADLPNGPWLVGITLRSGTVEHTASERLTFPDAGQAAVSGTVLTNPWLIAGGVLLLALLVLAALLVLVRRLRHDSRRPPAVPIGSPA